MKEQRQRNLFAAENPLGIDTTLHNLFRHFEDKFFKCIDAIEVIEHVPARKQTKKKEEMYKIVVKMEKDKIEISERANMPEVLEKRSSLKEISVDGNVVKEKYFTSLGVIKDIMGKCLGEKLNDKQTAFLSTVSTSSSPPPLREWMQALILDDDMVDSFARFFLDRYPKYQRRFTCWDQSRNQRYRNCGSRIDFILVDKSLFADAVTALRPLDGARSNNVKAHSHMAALVAATANFGWQAIPFQGERIDAPQRVYEVHLGEPSTGLIYTPPTWSDHIATQFLLSARSNTNLKLRTDKETKYAQPQKTLRSIKSFFGAKKVLNKEKPREVRSETTSLAAKAATEMTHKGCSNDTKECVPRMTNLISQVDATSKSIDFESKSCSHE